MFKSPLKMWVYTVSLLILVVPFSSGQEIKSSTTYSFGVVPQHAASKITRLWTPVLNWVSKRCDCKLKVRTAKNIPEFEKQLALGQFDFAYMNPYHFTVFNQHPGYQAIARQKSKLIKGILVTRKDSLNKRLRDLQDQTLAFPSPAAFAASILTQSHLKEAGVDFAANYVSSHDSVYLTVAKGLFPAGGGVLRTLNNAPQSVKSQLRILWKSDGFTPHAIAVMPRVPKTVHKSVKEALISMKIDKEGMALLNKLNFKKGLQAASNQDWDDVRQLNIESIENKEGA